jgi:hypothetical protein
VDNAGFKKALSDSLAISENIKQFVNELSKFAD